MNRRFNQIEDMVGKRFGRWTVLRRYASEQAHARWLCVCDCGTERDVSGATLRVGQSTSCGCFVSELNVLNKSTHGMYGTRTYRIWQTMKRRCHSPNSTGYANYGLRGITVCQRWRDGFANFLADMGEAPVDLSIDRINPNGNYEPANCRWATDLEQQGNKRSCVYVRVDGAVVCMAEAARRLSITRAVADRRLREGKIERVVA